MDLFKKFWKDEDGQTMTEYVIIVAMVAIACIVVMRLFGDDIRKIFVSIRNKLHDEY